ncbi:MAG TPA: DnaJ domain-containing protein [Patescibacteria group bacterium]|nr:DnaJ domain-containing protein [Patescibacteria group bacterium]
MKTAYEILGIHKNAAADEIREAFRKTAKELHPDSDEGDKEKFQALNNAYEQLGKGRTDDKNLEIRRRYDESLISFKPKNIEGRQSQTPASSWPQTNDLNDFLGRQNPFGFGNTDFFGQPIQQKQDEFRLAENDIALLAGLTEAYKSKEPGTWLIKKSEKDTRQWMPNIVWSIKREEDGRVSIYRTIKDWRRYWERDNEIVLYKKDKPWEKDLENSLSANARLSEDYIYGAGSRRIAGLGVDHPYDVGGYLNAMRSLAIKFAKGTDQNKNYDVSKEVGVLDLYSRNSSKFRFENEKPMQFTLDEREVVKIIPFNQFWKEFETAKSRIEKPNFGNPERK